MTTSLLNDIKTQLTPDMVQYLSSLLGESPANTQKAVDQVLPTLLASVMHLSSSSEDGPTRLVNLISHRNYERLLNNLSGLFDKGNTAKILIASGRDILSTLFAGKLSAVSTLIANDNGVTNASASSLLSLTAPLVVGTLGRTRAAQGLNAVGLTTLLLGQREGITELAPTGLASVFGLNNFADLNVKPVGATSEMTPNLLLREVTDSKREKNMLPQWRWPVLGALAVGLLYFFVGRDTGVTQSLMVNWAPVDTPAVTEVTLPGGAALSLKEGSFTYNVAKFLGDASTTIVPQSFVFDHLNFDSGTAHLTTESVQTVKDLLAILKAYPDTNVQLDGYTDNMGDADTNKKLSLERAIAVQETLIRGGIGATRVTTAGYGQKNPLATNATEDGRATNRRLELVVIKKG